MVFQRQTYLDLVTTTFKVQAMSVLYMTSAHDIIQTRRTSISAAPFWRARIALTRTSRPTSQVRLVPLSLIPWPEACPGPGAYGKDDKAAKPAKKAAPTSINDRYAALQKKLEDLERVHLDGKKAVRAYFVLLYLPTQLFFSGSTKLSRSA
jgi:hypothetical protein